MTAEIAASTVTTGEASDDGRRLRLCAIAAGLSCAVLFVIVGLFYRLELYADGALFSYAVATQESWAFHWHNISDRLFVYLLSHVPAETYIGLTGDAQGGIILYGLLFFAAPLLGLIATFLLDRSPRRLLFAYACFSTAVLCPLVFGFPSEMWVAHALFWPTLAACHYARRGLAGTALVLGLLLALILTHAGALIFAGAIVLTLWLCGGRDAAFRRASLCLVAGLVAWTGVKIALPPDPYLAEVLRRAALHVFDFDILERPIILLLASTLAGYAVALAAARLSGGRGAHWWATFGVLAALILYWGLLDRSLHAADRYHMRTLVIVATPLLGIVAVLHAHAEQGLAPARLHRVWARLETPATAGAILGALALVLVVHAVEGAKFVTAWTSYQRAVRALAIGSTSDPVLGDERFVSSRRIAVELEPLAWFSTTHFLSVLLAPGFVPQRLVIDPDANFFWLDCATASASVAAQRAVPEQTRRLVQIYSCLHRERLARSPSVLFDPEPRLMPVS